ncbi:MAG: hypothetical protein OEY93_06720 [Anaerolineae bacterium]|nr:hypothetical protein [Anaerolineae bacterium]
MDNGMTRKYEKAKMYAEQRDRIEFKSFEVAFDGANNPHTVTYADGVWKCDCEFFIGRDRCTHTMALEIILDQMLPEAVAE